MYGCQRTDQEKKTIEKANKQTVVVINAELISSILATFINDKKYHCPAFSMSITDFPNISCSLSLVSERQMRDVLQHDNITITDRTFCFNDFRAFFSTIEHKTLSALNLSRNKLETKSAINIGTSLSINFAQSKCGILKMSSTCLANNYTLIKLNLSWNQIRGRAAVTLLRAFEVNTCIKDLDLSWNGLGYDGSIVLRRIFKINETLTYLNISHNNIDWKATKIGFNPLTSHGIHDIVEAIHNTKKSALSMLDLSGLSVFCQTVRLAENIAMERRFLLKYECELQIHDYYGAPHVPKSEPLQKMIKHIDDQKWRTLEYFRTMDKQVQFKIENENISKSITVMKPGVCFGDSFASGQKTGMQLQNHELHDITRLLSLHTVKALTYKDLDQILNKKKLEERLERSKQKKRKEQVKKKNLIILQAANEHFPDIAIIDKYGKHVQAITRLATPKTYDSY
ncbi:unnamed protein product [Didymodactylos carnosus]|uniref:Uncharacterized protein n=1 Tax=Didymodactylos carnosus TaxID=1234261 RepID=A0A814XK55_9BILA|nr:unnamed protein product [Didymodactylos carnosus]CAF1217083.1 unnamed protein product [Didymodactylos carnosus]CAF3703889.1 unnamed protein product [Didymodactylos carnosus]CAF3980796.1 unnamed protein product [Didymodactylos carnosus]